MVKFGDYIIVNVQNYTVKNKRTNAESGFCNVFCIPTSPKGCLSLSDKSGILRYGFSSTLPFKIGKSICMGASVLCEYDDKKGHPTICTDEIVNFGYYVRCIHLAKVIDSYFPLCETDNDFKIIDVLSNKLGDMLALRLKEVFESRNNKALLAFGNRTIKKMLDRLDTHENIVNLVQGIMEIDKQYYVEPEYKIIEDDEFVQ